jgi:hypothetical protein
MNNLSKNELKSEYIMFSQILYAFDVPFKKYINFFSRIVYLLILSIFYKKYLVNFIYF